MNVPNSRTDTPGCASSRRNARATDAIPADAPEYERGQDVLRQQARWPPPENNQPAPRRPANAGSARGPIGGWAKRPRMGPTHGSGRQRGRKRPVQTGTPPFAADRQRGAGRPAWARAISSVEQSPAAPAAPSPVRAGFGEHQAGSWAASARNSARRVQAAAAHGAVQVVEESGRITTR
ncbi:hypothetical protein FQR65_LT18832 [Abscondita terminalis]|nr:hypothetical protein FQR65_LT18832 [Abscondita terminalis]